MCYACLRVDGGARTTPVVAPTTSSHRRMGMAPRAASVRLLMCPSLLQHPLDTCNALGAWVIALVKLWQDQQAGYMLGDTSDMVHGGI